MTHALTELELLRREKLIWLYSLETSDEGSGGETPTASELRTLLMEFGLRVDLDTVTEILNREVGISHDQAGLIEQAFNLSAGWLSQS